MKRILLFILTLGILAWIAKGWIEGPNAKPGESSQAKTRLDGVRERTRAVERSEQNKVDEFEKKAQPAE